MKYILANKITESWLMFTHSVFTNGEPRCNAKVFPYISVAALPHNSATVLPYSSAEVFPHSNATVSPYKYGWRVGVSGKTPNISYLLQKIGCDNYGK